MALLGLNRFTALTVAAFAAAVPASAADGAFFAISARVPTVCEVRMASSAIAPITVGKNELGTLAELCNNVDGYTVTLNHPSGLSNAWIEIGSDRIALSPAATQTVIVNNDAPADRARPISLILDQAPASDLTLSLDAQAKGMIF